MLIGALVALLSVLEHTPVWVASVRGFLAFFAIRWAAKIGLGALRQALQADADRAAEKPER